MLIVTSLSGAVEVNMARIQRLDCVLNAEKLWWFLGYRIYDDLSGRKIYDGLSGIGWYLVQAPRNGILFSQQKSPQGLLSL